MIQFLRERRALLLLAVMLAVLFALMATQVRQGVPSSSETMLLRLASPFLRAGAAVTDGIAGLWHEYVDLRHTRSRNAALEERIARLQLQLQQIEEGRVQTERLRALLDLKQAMEGTTVAATVVANKPTGLSHTILIDRGFEAGIRPNMAVVSAQGVVGRVWTVSNGVSKVQLITDAAAGTAVLVQRTRVQGILLGRGSELCSLEYVSTLDDVKDKDLLVTSGLDGIYPKGLPVGRVGELGPRAGLLQAITVVPRVEFNRLEEVLVLLQAERP
jgi:rod shape-determining protein MreC